MWKKMGFAFLAGVLCMSVILYYSQRSNSKRIDELSNAITVSEAANKRLTDENKQLRDLNSSVTARLGDLEKRIITDNIRYTETIGRVKDALGEIATGLDTSTGTIQDIIDGLGRLAEAIKALPNL